MKQFKVWERKRITGGNEIVIEPLYECMIARYTTPSYRINSREELEAEIKKVFRLRSNDFKIEVA